MKEFLGLNQTELNAIVNKLNEIGTEALGYTTTITQINSIGAIVSGLICAIVVYFSAKEGIKNIKLFKTRKDDELTFASNIVIIFLIVGCGIGIIINLFDIWNWVGMFNPKLKLIKALVDKVISI